MNPQNEISSTLFISIGTFLLFQIKTPILVIECLWLDKKKFWKFQQDVIIIL